MWILSKEISMNTLITRSVSAAALVACLSLTGCLTDSKDSVSAGSRRHHLSIFQSFCRRTGCARQLQVLMSAHMRSELAATAEGHVMPTDPSPYSTTQKSRLTVSIEMDTLP